MTKASLPIKCDENKRPLFLVIWYDMPSERGYKGVFSNTIINIKFIDYEQKVFYAYDGGYAGCRLVV